MKKIIYFVLLFSSSSYLFAAVNFPQDNFIDGWKKGGHSNFSAQNLYGYINGGAELFLEFGFNELIIQRYQNGDAEISAEVYIMVNPLAALGIYLAKSGKETPDSTISARNSFNKFQYTIVRDKYFILINNFEGNEEFALVMASLAQHILESLPENSNSDVWKYLPEQDRIAGSEQMIRGPYSLEPIYTFGNGDILELNGEIFGYVADYRGDNSPHKQIVIPYSDVEKATAVYQNVLENLDPYLKIVDQTNDQFVFEDYQHKFGVIKVDGRFLTLKIHLAEKPEIK